MSFRSPHAEPAKDRLSPFQSLLLDPVAASKATNRAKMPGTLMLRLWTDNSENLLCQSGHLCESRTNRP